MKTASVLLVLLLSRVVALAADRTNYSGTYSPRKPGPPKQLALQVVQSESDIEITRESAGKKVVTRVPLDGSPVECTTSGGTAGKCRAQFVGAALVIESNVFTRSDPKAPIVRIHLKENWQLSQDGKTLTIKNEVDSPQVPAEILQLIAPNNP